MPSTPRPSLRAHLPEDGRAALAVAVLLALFALLPPAPAHAARTFEPCRYEDGPGPCVWDARHRGNGTGDSFILRRDGDVRYITHRRAHRISR
jgi:hypothetical protein